jgi:hypothetical protein
VNTIFQSHKRQGITWLSDYQLLKKVFTPRS